MPFRTSLATIGFFVLCGGAQAQAVNGQWSSHGSFQSSTASDTWRFHDGSQQMTAPTPAQRQIAEQRLRIAAGLVRKGRCDEALKLALRQNDKSLEAGIKASCATQPSV